MTTTATTTYSPLMHFTPSEGSLITQTIRVRKPSGEVVEVNRFDFNLSTCAGGNSFIQCSDTTWIRAKNLTPVAIP